MFWGILDHLASLLFFFLHVTNSGSFPKALSATEERRCLEEMAAGDRRARQKLIEHNMRLVAHIAKKYFADENDRDDLVSIGTIGLIKAVDTFKPDKGIRLSSYASRCIENAILSQQNEMPLSSKSKVLLAKNGRYFTGFSFRLDAVYHRIDQLQLLFGGTGHLFNPLLGMLCVKASKCFLQLRSALLRLGQDQENVYVRPLLFESWFNLCSEVCTLSRQTSCRFLSERMAAHRKLTYKHKRSRINED